MSEEERIKTRDSKAIKCFAFLQSRLSKEDLKEFAKLFLESGMVTFGELVKEAC